jgi:hypothetical protein
MDLLAQPVQHWIPLLWANQVMAPPVQHFEVGSARHLALMVQSSCPLSSVLALPAEEHPSRSGVGLHFVELSCCPVCLL